MRILIAIFLLTATAHAATVTHLTLPGNVGTNGQVVSSTGNQLICARIVSPHTITGATKLACGWPIGVGGSTSGCATYNDADAGAQLATASASTAAATVVSSTGNGSTTYAEGTIYRVCVCSTATATVNYLSAQDNATGTGHEADVENTFAVFVGTAANGCSTGVPPSTTGALTGSTGFKVPIVVIE